MLTAPNQVTRQGGSAGSPAAGTAQQAVCSPHVLNTLLQTCLLHPLPAQLYPLPRAGVRMDGLAVGVRVFTGWGRGGGRHQRRETLLMSTRAPRSGTTHRATEDSHDPERHGGERCGFKSAGWLSPKLLP